MHKAGPQALGLSGPAVAVFYDWAPGTGSANSKMQLGQAAYWPASPKMS